MTRWDYPGLAGISRIQPAQELTDSGWFNGGLGPLLTELSMPELKVSDEDP